MAGHAPPSEEPLPRGKGRVLLVDDEAMVARVGQEHLERLNYEVVVCLSSVEALEAFRAAPQRFDLIITDQTMPQMTGDALAQALRRIRSDIPIILCTGFSHTMDPESARTLGIDAWLGQALAGTRTRPHDPEGLSRAAPRRSVSGKGRALGRRG